MYFFCYVRSPVHSDTASYSPKASIVKSARKWQDIMTHCKEKKKLLSQKPKPQRKTNSTILVTLLVWSDEWVGVYSYAPLQWQTTSGQRPKHLLRNMAHTRLFNRKPWQERKWVTNCHQMKKSCLVIHKKQMNVDLAPQLLFFLGFFFF